MADAFIALGSNLNDPRRQLDRAIDLLDQQADILLYKVSSYYENPPMPGSAPNQPNYINAVVWLKTELKPQTLLQLLLDIEQQLGRQRRERWEARVIDLDFLLYDNLMLSESALQLPHLGLQERAFVVIPLYEIAPDLVLPDGTRLKELRREFMQHTLEKLT